jgi:hypothetical protein
MVLCKDRQQQHFIEKLCARLDIDPIRVEPAPSGRGDAKQWVAENYPERVKMLRSKIFQKNLGLLVVVDGDNRGVEQRKRYLDQKLTSKRMPVRAPEEPIAIFVPTSSIETWLAWLCGRRPISEVQSYKYDGAYKAAFACGAVSVKRAADGWEPPDPAEAANVPALSDARKEAAKLP